MQGLDEMLQDDQNEMQGLSGKQVIKSIFNLILNSKVQLFNEAVRQTPDYNMIQITKTVHLFYYIAAGSVLVSNLIYSS